MEKTVFSGLREQWFPLYQELKRMAGQALGGFEARLTGAAALWRHGACFTELGAKKDCMTVAFASNRGHDEWEAAKVLQTSKNRYVHYFEVRDGKDFPVLVDRIAAAYSLTKPAKPPKREGDRAEYQSIDEYIARFPPPQRGIMEEVRQAIRNAAPEASEKISWRMPTFYQHGNLIHFAAAKRHVGLYPGAEAVESFRDKLAACQTTKGAIRFPWDQPIPCELIAGITRFCVERNKNRSGAE